MDPITIGNIAISTLLFISELLPFIKSNNYNGIVDLVIKFLAKIRGGGGAAVADTGDTVIVEEQSE